MTWLKGLRPAWWFQILSCSLRFFTCDLIKGITTSSYSLILASIMDFLLVTWLKGLRRDRVGSDGTLVFHFLLVTWLKGLRQNPKVDWELRKLGFFTCDLIKGITTLTVPLFFHFAPTDFLLVTWLKGLRPGWWRSGSYRLLYFLLVTWLKGLRPFVSLISLILHFIFYLWPD